MWHPPESNLTVSAQATNQYNELKHCSFKIIATSLRCQWGNTSNACGLIITVCEDDYGLGQNCSNFIAYALELLQSCALAINMSQ